MLTDEQFLEVVRNKLAAETADLQPSKDLLTALRRDHSRVGRRARPRSRVRERVHASRRVLAGGLAVVAGTGLAMAIVLGAGGSGGFGPLQGVPGPVAALAAELDQPGEIVYMAFDGETPPGIDQMWTTIPANGAVSGTSRTHELAADGKVYDSETEVRGSQQRMLYYESSSNTLTISGWSRSTPSRPPADAVAGSFDALGVYAAELPTLLRTGQARVVGGVQRVYSRPAYKIATPAGGFVMFVSADLKHPSLLGTGSYDCPSSNRQYHGGAQIGSSPSGSSCPLTPTTPVRQSLRVTAFRITRDPAALDITAAHPHARIIHTPAPTCPSQPAGIVGLRCVDS